MSPTEARMVWAAEGRLAATASPMTINTGAASMTISWTTTMRRGRCSSKHRRFTSV
jgi:hypothetical protein